MFWADGSKTLGSQSVSGPGRCWYSPEPGRTALLPPKTNASGRKFCAFSFAVGLPQNIASRCAEPFRKGRGHGLGVSSSLPVDENLAPFSPPWRSMSRAAMLSTKPILIPWQESAGPTYKRCCGEWQDFGLFPQGFRILGHVRIIFRQKHTLPSRQAS